MSVDPIGNTSSPHTSHRNTLRIAWSASLCHGRARRTVFRKHTAPLAPRWRFRKPYSPNPRHASSLLLYDCTRVRNAISARQEKLAYFHSTYAARYTNDNRSLFHVAGLAADVERRLRTARSLRINAPAQGAFGRFFLCVQHFERGGRSGLAIVARIFGIVVRRCTNFALLLY